MISTKHECLAVLENFLRQQGIGDSEKILVAFSGGADSLALLIALSSIHGNNLQAVYVNHHIRSDEELSAEIELNRVNASKLSVPFTILDINDGDFDELVKKGGVECAARILRYRCLDEYARNNEIKYIFTAHNCNDDDEEEIIRFFRGNTGFCSIKKVSGNVYRPFLALSHKCLENFVRESGFEYSVDSTNFDNENLRSQIRQRLVPHIERVFPSFSSAMLERRKTEALLTDDFGDRDVFDAFSLVGTSNSNNGRISRKDVNRILEFAAHGNNSGKIEYADAVVFRQNNNLVIAKKQALQNSGFYCNLSGTGLYKINENLNIMLYNNCYLNESDVDMRSIPNILLHVRNSNLVVRSRRSGDRIKLKGRLVEVEHLLKKSGISSLLAGSVPVVESDNRIVAVILAGFSKRNYVTDDLMSEADALLVFSFATTF